MPIFRHGDSLAIQRITGFSTFGTFMKQDDDYIVVKGTVGENIGNEIIIPKSNIDQIVVVERKSSKVMTRQERNDW